MLTPPCHKETMAMIGSGNPWERTKTTRREKGGLGRRSDDDTTDVYTELKGTTGRIAESMA